ncbi:hypothetical protein STCU_07469 [Strigomonas culicis]|uniref:Uncharacterized protein n=1 Tax=Strigomonas culicis TaxID=28005 RepID=S9V9W0_9TRYP|nr:hypothetical protein STCU_07469 [Strigomonas culicis]|eukprot:EPY23771.1 hypothetical protein STCU_07469 [Strigomonas culicis]
MGVPCSCSEEEKYRYKKFVVSVYPADRHGGPNEEALGTLNSYVASNPERIPRICRKIEKLFLLHLRAQKKDRVMVSVRALRVLIEKAPAVDGFVPHSIDMCARLLEQRHAPYLVGAADVLCILCYRLCGVPGSESSRRLIANARDRLIPPLQKMAAEAIQGGADGHALQNRYAAVLALGHIAACLHSALSAYACDMVGPLLTNLLLLIRERERQQTEVDAASLVESIDRPPATSALLPEADVLSASIRASCFGIGATAGCVTSAGVEPFLARVIAFLDGQRGWAVYLAPVLVFHALAASMEARPQRLGCAVYQRLCALGMRNADPQVCVGVLRALGECVLAVPMSGGRPQDLLRYLLAVVAAPNSSGEPYAHSMNEATVDLTASLLRATYRQRNAPQLQSILANLRELVRGTDEQAPNVLLVLRCIAVAAPYVRTAPLADRHSLGVVGVLRPFLVGAHDQRRTMAARALRGLLAGVPEAADGDAPPSAAATLSTDEADILFAEEWLQTVVGETRTVTPRCVVQVANTAVAILNGCSTPALPFLLNWLHALQERCLSAGGKRSSPLSRAWLHMVVVVVIRAGEVLGIRKLREYGEDILRRRAAAKEVAPCFHLELSAAASPSERFTLSGLTARPEVKKAVLAADDTEPPVTKILNFDFVTSVLVDAERDDVLAVFGATAATLKAAIAETCLTAERKVCLQGEASVRSPSASTLAVPFSLRAPGDAAGQLDDIEVVLADPGASRRGSVPLTGHTMDERIRSVMAQYSVTAETSIRPTQITITDATPLPLFSSDDDEDHAAGHSMRSLESSLAHDAGEDDEESMMDKRAGTDHAIPHEAQPPTVRKLWVANLPSSKYINVE